MVPMLRGNIPPGEFEQRVGCVRPATHRLAFYRLLMQRNVRHILQQLFPATRRAIVSLGAKPWESVTERFEQAHSLTHWDPNELGASFPSFVAGLAAIGELPPHAEEVADFEWLCFVVTYSADESEIGLDSRLHVREYEHDIPSFVLDSDLTKPEAGTTPVLIFRSPTDHRAHYRRPLVTDLAAIAGRLRGEPSRAFTPEALADADRRLVDLGVLPPRRP